MKLNSNKTEKQSVEEDLTAARNQMNQKTHKLRDQLIQAHTVAKKQLSDLTVQSDNAAKKLQAVIAKVKRLTSRLSTTSRSSVCLLSFIFSFCFHSVHSG